MSILFIIAHVIDYVAVAMLLVGFVKSTIRYVQHEVKGFKLSSLRSVREVRNELGGYILLSLDFLIISDIIHTITALDQEKLIELGAIVVMRTVIGYFLGKEVQEMEALQKND